MTCVRWVCKNCKRMSECNVSDVSHKKSENMHPKEHATTEQAIEAKAAAGIGERVKSQIKGKNDVVAVSKFVHESKYFTDSCTDNHHCIVQSVETKLQWNEDDDADTCNTFVDVVDSVKSKEST